MCRKGSHKKEQILCQSPVFSCCHITPPPVLPHTYITHYKLMMLATSILNLLTQTSIELTCPVKLKLFVCIYCGLTEKKNA